MATIEICDGCHGKLDGSDGDGVEFGIALKVRVCDTCAPIYESYLAQLDLGQEAASALFARMVAETRMAFMEEKGLKKLPDMNDA